MMDLKKKLSVQDHVVSALAGLLQLEPDKDLSEKDIEKQVQHFCNLYNYEGDQKEIIQEVSAQFQHTMSIGTIVLDKSEYKPWLHNRAKDIDWYYWDRYKKYLIQGGFGGRVVLKMQEDLDQTLNLLQDPADDGEWSRKGLVVGNVQAGKTANYMGLVTKAIDAGYKVVIIFAGILNSLRKQTQQRVDKAIIGRDSSKIFSPFADSLVGVGEPYKLGTVGKQPRIPITLTTETKDFNKNYASQFQSTLGNLNEPVVLVIKKNVSILKNLNEWFKSNNFDLNDYPLLIIDDEADHASINTNKEDLDPTKTNQQIRSLISMFPKNAYVGYTATPFANIFIQPTESNNDVDDLFPSHFIKTLDPPTNYLGAYRIFNEKNPDILIELTEGDYKEFLPLNHKIEDVPDYLPETLIEAIQVFVLVSAIRLCRGQINSHNSMLINVSRFTDIQSSVKDLVYIELHTLIDAIRNYSSLNENEAFQNAEIRQLHNTWSKRLKKNHKNWSEIQSNLIEAATKIEVVEFNSSSNGISSIDYEEYPNGRSIIAIGGYSLSRGLTLEGLTVSYFLRNSEMSDSLMQMGRWFGYRDNYEDLCRIYLTERAVNYYTHISTVTAELFDEFKTMSRLGKTPMEFGLAVRNHPDKPLQLTARNKMRSASTVTSIFDFSGRLISTKHLTTKPEHVKVNLEAANHLLEMLRSIETNQKHGLGNQKHELYSNVSYELVFNFIETFKNYYSSYQTDTTNLLRFLNDQLKNNETYKAWRVLFFNNSKPRKDLVKSSLEHLQDLYPSFKDKCIFIDDGDGIEMNQRQLFQSNFSKTDMVQLDPDEPFRKVPILIVQLSDCRLNDKSSKNNRVLFSEGCIGYGIEFPGEKNSRSAVATFQTNVIYQKYLELIEDQGELESELIDELE